MNGTRRITEAELATLADGSMAPERRDELLRHVEASVDLARPLAGQRFAIEAVRGAQEARAPAGLRAAVEAMATRPPRRTARRLPLAIAAATTAALAAVALVLAFGGSSGPGVSEAARVALAPAIEPAPAVARGGLQLADSGEDIAHPSWRGTGWRPVGGRRDIVDHRAIRTVFYGDGDGDRIGYAIASGAALPADGGRLVERAGIRLRVLRADGANVVTWLRGGHTCVVAGRGVSADELLWLATLRSA